MGRPMRTAPGANELGQRGVGSAQCQCERGGAEMDGSLAQRQHRSRKEEGGRKVLARGGGERKGRIGMEASKQDESTSK